MFYDLFCDLCKEKGVSVTKATVDIGLSRTIGTKWKKTGATPNGETLNKIAAYFGVSADYLLGTETEKTPTPEGRRIDDGEIMAAFFRGADPTLTEEEMGALWEDARSYMEYKLAQRSKRGKNESST